MLSVKHARKQERARITRRTAVMGRVAASQTPLLVKIGVRSWKAKRVPVGRRLARLPVLSNARERALWDGGGGGGGVGVTEGEGEVDGGLDDDGLCLRDIVDDFFEYLR